MKRIILAMIAASSLSLPALAQNDTKTPSQSSPSAASSQAMPNEISPEKLKTAQVHQLQQALNDKGFSVGAVDGEWGTRTEDALKKFQSSNNMPSSGQINGNTITALGLNSSDFGVTSTQTTGQAPAGSNNQPSNSEPNKDNNRGPAH